ncbi:MAG: DUF86 domain-containing protein [Nitrospirae bacterium]|nr:DUF86 domain-containing protein [Nitrospirota bacterium]
MTRDYKLFISDIADAIKDIEEFIGNMGYEEFLKDNKTKNAVVWEIHVIGEATKNIPSTIKSKYKKLPWKDMAGIRDKIAHFYFGIDYAIVWKVVKERLPEIREIIDGILKDLSESN